MNACTTRSQTITLMRTFLSTTNLPQVSDSQTEPLNRPITHEEVKEALFP